MTQDLSATRLIRVCSWCLLALSCALLSWEIPRREIDPDELEHLHAGFCVWNGDVPYRDFFEHHAPALYYFIWPIFKWQGPTLAVLWSARSLMLGCSLGTLWLTNRLAARWGGELSGLLAMTLLSWTTIFQTKGIELRPDVPATFLLVLAANCWMRRSGDQWRTPCFVGGLLGLSLLFTQKCIVPATGLGIAIVISFIWPGHSGQGKGTSNWKELIRPVFWIIAGAGMIWLAATILFAAAGAARQFWFATWYQLWTWPVRSSRWDYLRPTLLGDLTVWCAAFIEIVSFFRQKREVGYRTNGLGIVAITTVVAAAAVPFVKATYPQFYLLWMPFLAALAGSRVATFLQPSERRVAGNWIPAAGLGLGVLQFGLWHRAVLAGPAGPFPRLTALDDMQFFIPSAIGAVIFGVAVACWKQNLTLARGLICLLGMAYGGLRSVESAFGSNAAQVAAIEQVQRYVPATGRVLDGFTGLAALRPHAWYHWWINEYSIALVPQTELEGGLLSDLQKAPPAGVLFDKNLELLPESVKFWIRRSYEPLAESQLWIPKSPRDR